MCAADSQGAFTNIDNLIRHFVLSHRDQQSARRSSLSPVFRIRNILVRIRILGPVPLTNGSRSSSGSWSFRQ
jgi:hypothetical protein